MFATVSLHATETSKNRTKVAETLRRVEIKEGNPTKFISDPEKTRTMELDPRAHKEAMHHIVTSLVTPRPIGWISTSNDKRDNLAPYSYFTLVNTYPPIVMFSASRQDGGLKHTPENAMNVGEFVVNIVTEDVAETMDVTSASLAEKSEFDYFDIERDEAAVVDAPRVADAVSCLECTVWDSMEVYDSVLVFGAVEHIFVDELIMTNDAVDVKKIRSVGRLGGAYYTGIELLGLKRHGFSTWNGPAPPGFQVDEETGWLTVEKAKFERFCDAVKRLETGEPIEDIATETPFERDELAAGYEQRNLYIEGKTDDERIEAALANAGYETTFSY